jgi:hypothetical protein
LSRRSEAVASIFCRESNQNAKRRALLRAARMKVVF